VKEDPARHLRHPKFHPRSELPEYLSEAQLRILMEHAANVCFAQLGYKTFYFGYLLTSQGILSINLVKSK